MSNGECQARDGMTNPDLCESEICCGFPDGQFRSWNAQECTALGHVIVRDDACQEAALNDDRLELTDGGTSAGGSQAPANAEGSSGGGCSTTGEHSTLPTPLSLLFLLGLLTIKRRRH